MKNEKVAVVIPIYKASLTKEELASLNSVKQKLIDIDVILFGPIKIKEFIVKLSNDFGFKSRIEFFENKFFKSISGYNRLLINKKFYETFSSYDFILIVQTDALIIGSSLDLLKFCEMNYSYIGAPWFDSDHINTTSPKVSGVGNGGLSLRNIKDHLFVLYTKCGSKSLKKKLNEYIINSNSGFNKFIKLLIVNFGLDTIFPVINEDRFWGFVVPKQYEIFKVASHDHAINFSFEAMPSYLYNINGNNLPFGCHAWERYDKNFWVNHLSLDIGK
jgi:hypothetical protein